MKRRFPKRLALESSTCCGCLPKGRPTDRSPKTFLLPLPPSRTTCSISSRSWTSPTVPRLRLKPFSLTLSLIEKRNRDLPRGSSFSSSPSKTLEIVHLTHKNSPPDRYTVPPATSILICVRTSLGGASTCPTGRGTHLTSTAPPPLWSTITTVCGEGTAAK